MKLHLLEYYFDDFKIKNLFFKFVYIWVIQSMNANFQTNKGGWYCHLLKSFRVLEISKYYVGFCEFIIYRFCKIKKHNSVIHYWKRWNQKWFTWRDAHQICQPLNTMVRVCSNRYWMFMIDSKGISAMPKFVHLRQHSKDISARPKFVHLRQHNKDISASLICSSKEVRLTSVLLLALLTLKN